MMPLSVLFVGNDGIQIHILHTLKDIPLHKGVDFSEAANQLLDFLAFGGTAAVCTAHLTLLRKPAGTL